MTRRRPALFRGRHFEDVIILLCVRWYGEVLGLEEQTLVHHSHDVRQQVCSFVIPHYGRNNDSGSGRATTQLRYAISGLSLPAHAWVFKSLGGGQ
jgi:hypothetical protein